MDTIPTALLSIQQEMCASFEHGNAAGVAAIYAEEGQMMPAHCTAISGRAGGDPSLLAGLHRHWHPRYATHPERSG